MGTHEGDKLLNQLKNFSNVVDFFQQLLGEYEQIKPTTM